jgi:hypothetical protein
MKLINFFLVKSLLCKKARFFPKSFLKTFLIMVDLGGQELGHGPPSPAAPWTPAAWPATYRNSSQRESTSSHQSGKKKS